MNRIEIANNYHKQGYNCCQSVLGAFADRLDIPEDTAMRLGAGFGSGAGTGELCGAITGAVMALDLIAGGDATSDPAGAKRRAAGRSRALQQLKALGIGDHCGVMIASAVEIAEEMLQEEGS